VLGFLPPFQRMLRKHASNNALENPEKLAAQVVPTPNIARRSMFCWTTFSSNKPKCAVRFIPTQLLQQCRYTLSNISRRFRGNGSELKPKTSRQGPGSKRHTHWN